MSLHILQMIRRSTAAGHCARLLWLMLCLVGCSTGASVDGPQNDAATADGSGGSGDDDDGNLTNGLDSQGNPDTPDKLPSCDEADRCGASGGCCDSDEECVDGVSCLQICEAPRARCGNSGTLCCDLGEVCLDGVVCAANCGDQETACGTNLDVCCPAGDVCVQDSCITPGATCGDDFDCLGGNRYCETTIGRCLDTPSDVVCETPTTFDAIDLVQEWHFPGATVDGKLYEQVIATPMVGDISGDGIPDVVVPMYHEPLDQFDNNRVDGDAVLVALSGDTGKQLFAIGGSYAPTPQAAVALANFDDDAALEIIYRRAAGGIRLIKGDGATILADRTAGGSMTDLSTPSLVDINADGTPDVVIGCHALNGAALEDPSQDFFDGGNCNFDSPLRSLTAVANLDDDPAPELTTGGSAYDLEEGRLLWGGNRSQDGFVAVADLNVDGIPEVISIRAGSVVVRDGPTGVVRIGNGGTWANLTVTIPGGGQGGPPTVADFDADGLPEISTAGREAYVVYDPDCLPTLPPGRTGGDCQSSSNTPFVRWQTETQDLSSSSTGSSVFDFQGDGAAEVVYNDECWLHIYNGSDGSEALSVPWPNSSRTDFEYPIVVDVDGDGNSEIVVPANRDESVGRDNCPTDYAAELGVSVNDLPDSIKAGTSGLYVLGDPNDRWVGTRPIWNQYSYHVTNITESGEVPTEEADNFLVPGLNNYRQNTQGGTVRNAPNLHVELDVATYCLDREVVLSAEVSNLGSRGVPPGVQVTFVRTDEQQTEPIATLQTVNALLPGASERVTTILTEIPTNQTLTFQVQVDETDDETGSVTECDETDNQAEGTGICELRVLQ